MTTIWILSLAAGIAVIALVVYGVFVEPYRIAITRQQVQISHLPEPLDGYTICHLSDLHTRSYGRLHRRLTGILSAINCDLAVITGDLVYEHSSLDVLSRTLSGLKTRQGIFAVLGNNDLKSGVAATELARCLENIGIRVLQNTHETLIEEPCQLHVIGVGDPYSAVDDIDAAMDGVPETDGFRLLLAHSPDIVMRLGYHRPHLILAGHTHGGQVKLPVVGPLWLHCRYRIRASDGYFGSDELSGMAGRDLSGVHMYVSRGIAWSLLRLRLMCPPQVVLITLRRLV